MLPRLFVILAVLAAWVVASNHCALAFLTATKADHACCACDQPQARNSLTACCKDLGAPLPAGTHVPSGPFQGLFVAWEGGTGVETVVAGPRMAEALFPSHGPPGALAFAELVLNRSLPAHAPPVVVS